MRAGRALPSLAAALVGLLCVGCPPHPGRLVVVVRTDFAVPAEMGELVASVRRTDGTSMEEVPFTLRASDLPDTNDGSRTMPLTFAIHPRTPGAEVEIEVTGLRRATTTTLVTRRAIVGFVAGSTRVLDLMLARACAADVVGVCAGETTCVDGECVPVPRVDPGTLPEIRNPGDELLLDAGSSTPRDASRDATSSDASPSSDASDGAAMSSDAGDRDAGCVLDPPFLLAPESGATSGGVVVPGALRPTFRWSPACGTHYELEVDDSCADAATCAFASPELSPSSILATSYTPTADLVVSSTVPVGRRYYWHVRACDGTTCSAWTAARYLDVGRAQGDVDGDGRSDLVVGAPWQDAGARDEGSAFVFLGNAAAPSPAPSVTLDNPTNEMGAFFGEAVARAGDLNGDGFGDVVIGATLQDNGARDEGNAFVYLGSATGLPATPSVVLDSPTNQATGSFGASVAAAGDVNGDGYADLLVGAWDTDNGAMGEGNAYLYLGSATGVATTPSVTFDNPANETRARFGFRVASAGDVNGDGYSDVAIGSYRQDSGAADSGSVFLYLGSASGPAALPDITIDNPAIQANGQFGASLAAGDVNGDGYSDLAVGANFQDAPEMDEGNVSVFLGGPGGTSTAASITIDNPADQSAAWFGHAVAIGDLNGDGYGDVIAGSIWWDGPEMDEGGAFVFLGGASGPGATPDAALDNPGDQNDGRFGSALAVPGDLDGDGRDDLVAGAFQQDGATVGEGQAFVFLGGATISLVPAVTIANPGGDSGGRFGFSVARADVHRPASFVR